MDAQIQSVIGQEAANSTYVCSHCKQKLPASAFYYNRRKQCYDNYCKECRKLSSRKQRCRDSYLQNINTSRPYPVITCIGDANVRMLLILEALQKVRESVARKLRKQREQEFKEFE